MNKTIIITKIFSETIETTKLFKIKENTIISLDYDSHIQLFTMGIQHNISDSYLNENDKTTINKATLNITTTWYKNKKIRDLLTINEINFGWLLEVELYYNLIMTIYDFISLQKIKEKENPNLVIVSNALFEMAKIVFTDSTIQLLETDTKKIQRFYFDTFPVKYNIGSIPLTFEIPRKYFFILRKYYEKFFIPLFNKLFSKTIKDTDSIILVDFNPAQYDEFLKSLSKKNQTVFLLNRRRVAIWNFKSFNVVRQTKCIPITYEQFLNLNDKNEINTLILDVKKRLDLLFGDHQLFSDIFSINHVSFWDYVKKYFQNFVEERFNEAIYEMLASRNLLSSLKPSLILHFYEVALQEKILIHQARKKNIDTILIQHGTPNLSFPELLTLNPIQGALPLYPDKKLVVWGNLVKEYAIKNGMKEENIIVAGSIRHDSYFKIKENHENKQGIILIALGQISSLNVEIGNISTFERYAKSLELICNAVKKITDRKKFVKLHPGPMTFNTVIVEPIIRRIDPSIKIIVETNLGKLIQSADVVIALGFTTFLLDSNIFKKPTMTVVYDPQDLLGMYSGNTAVFQHDENEKFEKYLNDLLTNRKTCEENVQNGVDFVNAYLVNHGCASEYLAKKLQNIKTHLNS